MPAAYRARVSSPPFAKSKSREAICGTAPESKATMSQNMVSCAFVMRRSARADFTGEYGSDVGLECSCGSQSCYSTLLMDYGCLMLIMTSASPK